MAKPAVERLIGLWASLSIDAQGWRGYPQHIENQRFYFSGRAARAHALKSLATFACRFGVDRIQPAASGKWGEVPVFDISRIEMTMFNDVTSSASKRNYAAAQQMRAPCSASEINDSAAIPGAKVVRQIGSFLAEASPAYVRPALVRSASL